MDRCVEELAEAGVPKNFVFSLRNVVDARKKRRYDPIYCHAPQASLWEVGPTGIKYWGFTKFNCAFAVAMAKFETIAQQEAHRIFETKSKTPIKGINHMGTYNCRRLRKKPTKQSQHSFGNAIDIGTFYIREVGPVDVKKHWNARYPYLAKRQEFLRTLVKRLREEQLFTNVLDPEWDEFHANHLHIDLAHLSDGLPSAALARIKGEPVPLIAPEGPASEVPPETPASEDSPETPTTEDSPDSEAPEPSPQAPGVDAPPMPKTPTATKLPTTKPGADK